MSLALAGCTSLNAQLHPTDMAEIEEIVDRDDREQAYIDNEIVVIDGIRGRRYTKGVREGARPRSWQSLDLILRSDRNSAAALPENKIRAARVLSGFLAASALALIGGFASSAREGLDLSRPTGTSAVLIGAGISTIAFGISAGVMWNKSRKGYESAVHVYNDSLALRLGISNANGEYIPPPGVLVDEEGYIILDQKELLIQSEGSGQTGAPAMQPPAEGPANPPAESASPSAVEADPEAAPVELPSVEPASEDPGSEEAAPLPASPSGSALSRLVGPARAATQP